MASIIGCISEVHMNRKPTTPSDSESSDIIIDKDDSMKSTAKTQQPVCVFISPQKRLEAKKKSK